MRGRSAIAGSVGAGVMPGMGQSHRSEGHRDQSQHQGNCAAYYSIAAAGTTCGDGQVQPAVDDGDQPRYQGHDRTHSPVTGAVTTGSTQSQPTDDHADQAQSGGRDGPESPWSRTTIRGDGR